MALNPFDHLLALTLALLFPLRARFVGWATLARAAPEDQSGMRGRIYVQALRVQWSLTLCLAVLWLAARRPAEALGLIPPEGWKPWTLFGAALAIGAHLLVRVRRVSKDDAYLEGARRRVAPMRMMLPHTAGDLRAFLLLSLTAGICEELLYRGFLLFYFGHWLGPVPALVVASIVFGLGHVYQGPRGVLATGLVGGLLGAAYLFCGWLVPSMLLHAETDMYSGALAQAALSREAPPVTPAAAGPPPTP